MLRPIMRTQRSSVRSTRLDIHIGIDIGVHHSPLGTRHSALRTTAPLTHSLCQPSCDMELAHVRLLADITALQWTPLLTSPATTPLAGDSAVSCRVLHTPCATGAPPPHPIPPFFSSFPPHRGSEAKPATL
ncbi:hypothetical protein ACLKA6_008144 [Drosophila palustris]